MNKFWMVLGAGMPVYKHASEDSARTEAERLAKIHQGSTFTVLESVSSVQVNGISWVDHEEVKEEPPESEWRLADEGDVGDVVLLSDYDILGELKDGEYTSIKEALHKVGDAQIISELNAVHSESTPYRFVDEYKNGWKYAFTTALPIPF